MRRRDRLGKAPMTGDDETSMARPRKSRSDQVAMDEALARALQYDDSQLTMDDAALARLMQQQEESRFNCDDEELARKLQAEESRFNVADEELARKLQAEEAPSSSLSDDERYARWLQEQESEPEDIAHKFQGLEVNPVTSPQRDVPSTSRRVDGHNHGDTSPDSSPRSFHSAPDNIDPDNMTYEELNELEESIGYVNKGLSAEKISRLPSFKYGAKTWWGKKKASVPKDAECHICLSKFQAGEKLVMLSCDHIYHETCVSKWLQTNKTCCVCKAEVSP